MLAWITHLSDRSYVFVAGQLGWWLKAGMVAEGLRASTKNILGMVQWHGHGMGLRLRFALPVCVGVGFNYRE